MINFELYSRGCKYNLDAKVFMLNFKNDFNFEKNIIKFGNIELHKRNHLHITLIGNTQSLELYEFLENKYTKEEINKIYLKITNIIKELLKTTNFEFKEEYHKLKKEYETETRHSIIQIVETNILEKMWKEIETITSFKLDYKLPHPHITIYKQKENVGIGLNKFEDLERLSLKKSKNINELYK